MNNKALCHNKKCGHNFPTVGGCCTQCGTSQEELSRKFEKISKGYKLPKAAKGVHSEMHALAKEISEYCNEPKKFAMYLGIIKNAGLKKTYKIFSEIKQSPNVKTPGKLFVYKSKYKNGETKPRTGENSGPAQKT